jgi:hypothetical protein
MTIYKLQANDKEYKELTLDCVELFEKLQLDPAGSGLKDCSDLGRTGLPFQHPWKEIESSFAPSPLHPEAVKIPSISVWIGSVLLLSEKAHACLRLILQDHGEFLPIDIQGFKYFLFNLLTTGKVDNQKTTYRYIEGDDIPSDIECLVFDADDIEDKDIFRAAPGHFVGVFCTPEFKQTCEEFDLDGLIFSEDISRTY